MPAVRGPSHRTFLCGQLKHLLYGFLAFSVVFLIMRQLSILQIFFRVYPLALRFLPCIFPQNPLILGCIFPLQHDRLYTGQKWPIILGRWECPGGAGAPACPFSISKPSCLFLPLWRPKRSNAQKGWVFILKTISGENVPFGYVSPIISSIDHYTERKSKSAICQMFFFCTSCLFVEMDRVE